MRRVIICGLYKYPRGGAHSNYIQYFVSALQLAGYKIEILSYINEEYSKASVFEYRGVLIHEISCKKGAKLFRRLMNGKLFTHTLRKKIKALKPTSEDIVFPGGNYSHIKAILKLKKSLRFRIANTPLEWFADEDFSNDYYRKEFRERFALNNNYDFIFPISHLIAEQFPNVPALILPPLTDAQEFPIAKKNEGKYEFILSANGKMKDALPDMLQGMAMLSDEQLNNMQMHLTGVKEETVRQVLNDSEFQRIKKSLIIHKWMQYDELISLYQKVHFLFLARKTCQMTMANFPSKVPEVMTHGIVPVVSRVGDYTKYYLEDNVNSLVFDGYDKTVCYNAFCRALDTPFSDYQRLSHGARKCAEERFDYRKWAEKIKDSLESMYERG